MAKFKAYNFCNVHEKTKKHCLPFPPFSNVDAIQFLQCWMGLAKFQQNKTNNKTHLAVSNIYRKCW